MEKEEKLPAAFPEVSNRGVCGHLRPVLPAPWAGGDAAMGGGWALGRPVDPAPGGEPVAPHVPGLAFYSPRPTLLAFSVHTREERRGNTRCPGKKGTSRGVCVQINTQRCLPAPSPALRGGLCQGALRGKPVLSREGSSTCPGHPPRDKRSPKFSVREGGSRWESL